MKKIQKCDRGGVTLGPSWAMARIGFDQFFLFFLDRPKKAIVSRKIRVFFVAWPA
jgi:hypothetical protein